MTKAKKVVLIVFFILVLALMPNISKATEVKVERNVYSSTSMKFTFSNLTLDKTHEYEYGLTKTAAADVETWHLLTEYTESTAAVDITTTTKDFREVVNIVDTGYITIKDKTSDIVVLEPYSVDLKIPFLQVTNYTVIPNGKDLDKTNADYIKIAVRSADNSKAYYQYEKITDESIINKYKEIKAKNGSVMELENILSKNVPNSNWSAWDYWYGLYTEGMDGYGYTERNVTVPDSGLYYMWVYFSGNNLKNVYGYILVDNLEPDIALENISLPKTQKIELGKTLILTPTFTPENATNKIVSWSSSNESVATVDNGGKVISKKLGSTVITAISQDGNKKATCTVTVVPVEEENNQDKNNNQTNNNQDKNNNSNNNNNGNTNKGTTNSGENNTKDPTTATGNLPYTGLEIGIVSFIVISLAIGVFTYFKYNKLKDI